MSETDVLQPIVGKNGVLIDPITRRFVAGGKVTTAITATSQLAGVQKKMARKRERVEAGALAFIRKADPDTWGDAEDGDWIEAVAEAQTAQALRVGDPGMTRAADWLMTHAGLGEKQVAEAPRASGLLEQALAGLIQAMTPAQAIDAEVVDAHELEGQAQAGDSG